MRNWDLFKEMDQLHREIDSLFNGPHRCLLYTSDAADDLVSV